MFYSLALFLNLILNTYFSDTRRQQPEIDNLFVNTPILNFQHFFAAHINKLFTELIDYHRKVSSYVCSWGSFFHRESFLSKKIIIKQNSLRTLSSKCRGIILQVKGQSGFNDLLVEANFNIFFFFFFFLTDTRTWLLHNQMQCYFRLIAD